MKSLGERFPDAEAALRGKIEDLIIPSEPAVQILLEEDAQGRCWVTLNCSMLDFTRQAAFAAADLECPSEIWTLWCMPAVEELDRRLRERGKSGW